MSYFKFYNQLALLNFDNNSVTHIKAELLQPPTLIDAGHDIDAKTVDIAAELLVYLNQKSKKNL